MNYYIYGAHSRGQTMGVYLEKIYPEWNNLGYLYDDDQENPEVVRGVPVFKIQGEEELDVSARVYMATRGSSFAHIREVLEEYGFELENIVPVDPALDVALRNKFVPEYFKTLGKEYVRLEDILDPDVGSIDVNAQIYVVRSAADSELMSVVPLRDGEIFIQAGRALSDTAIVDCNLADNTGDNISDRNRQMCELTAMYWIWKNLICAKTDAENNKINVVGLEHYRRRFILPENWNSSFARDKADVILPVPLFVNPSIMGNYIERHARKPWDSMMSNLKKIHGGDIYEDARDFFENTGCYSPCNMLIARNDAFAAVCEFVFSVIFAVMEECGTIEDNYQNRYPGFLSERLITYYFHRNVDRFRICYADKSFLI